MQDEINEKTIALYIKTGKLTAQTLQKAMKKLLEQMKKQKGKAPQGKQTLKQLMKQNTGMGNSVLTVSGFFKQGATDTAADKMMKVLEAETAAAPKPPYTA